VLGSFVPLLARDWDQIPRAMVLGFLIVLVAIWAAIAICELLFAPNNERFRIIPIDTATARVWFRRLTVFAGWFAFVWVVIQECEALDFSDDGAQVVAYTLGLSIVAIALESVWRKPIAPHQSAGTPAAEARHLGRIAVDTSRSIGIVLLWVFWVAEPGLMTVMPAFWLVLVLITLPPAISGSRRAIEHLLRPPGSSQTGVPPSLVEVTLGHGIRA